VILDTSALVAILLKEADADTYLQAISRASRPIAVSAATLVEATIVLESRGGREMGDDLDAFIRRLDAGVIAVAPEQAETARDGWRRFGKGRHKAALNLGDCFAYALAKQRDEPLLFKGDDFAETDVKRAI
jgi:ribonuclease VapC